MRRECGRFPPQEGVEVFHRSVCPYYLLLYLLVEYYLYVCDPFRYKKSTLVTPLGTNSDVLCDPFRYRKTP